ncbi:MAG: hypothetical protein QM723_39155 [Myxococcaceae bacterium]
MKMLINAMKVMAIVGLTAGPAMAQTAGDKVKETGNDIKREGRKGANRVDESLCTGTKAECAARKAKHRGQETKDAVDDKATEVKDRVEH